MKFLKKLILLNYHFDTNQLGHVYTYNILLANEATKQGIDTEIWAPLSLSGFENDKIVKKVLEVSLFEFKNQTIIQKLLIIPRLFKDIIKNFRDKRLDENTIILIEDLNFQILFSIFLASFFLKPKFRLVIILRQFDSPFIKNSTFKFLIKNIVYLILIKLVITNKWITVGSDSELITAALAKFGIKNTSVLPIPHIPQQSKPCVEKTISYLGAARVDKGFDLLPEIIEQCITELNENVPELRFLIQSIGTDDDPIISKTKETLKHLSEKFKGKIILIDKSLDRDSYIKLLSKSWILLNLYKDKIYKNGTSGIFAEGIGLGKWIIVPENTWMAMQTSKYDKIKVIKDLNSKSVLQAIKECLASEPRLDKERIKNQIKNWRSFHSSENYINILKNMIK